MVGAFSRAKNGRGWSVAPPFTFDGYDVAPISFWDDLPEDIGVRYRSLSSKITIDELIVVQSFAQGRTRYAETVAASSAHAL